MKEFNFRLKLFGLTILSLEYSTKNYEVEEAPAPEINFNDLMKKETSPISTVGTGTIRPDLRELEKKLNNDEEVPKPIKVKCSSCNGTTYDDDIDFCSKCGKEICSNCGSLDTDGKKYCPKCWAVL